MEPIVKGQKAVAGHFKVSDRTVRNWIKEGMPGKRYGGRYDLPEIQRWLDAKEGHPFGRPKGSEVDSRQGTLVMGRGEKIQDERWKKAKADLAEMEVRQRRGELVELSDLEGILTPRAMAYRQGIVGLQRTLPPQIAQALKLPPETMRVMEALIMQAGREILANVLRGLALGPGQVLEFGPEVTHGDGKNSTLDEQKSPTVGEDEN